MTDKDNFGSIVNTSVEEETSNYRFRSQVKPLLLRYVRYIESLFYILPFENILA